MAAPKLIVFDLDFTLWDCGGTWCDCLTSPFRSSGGRVLDRRNQHVTFYPDVLSVLDFCDAQSMPIALASRTEQPAWARELLDLLAATHRFAFAEIYPSSKVKHFSALRDATGLEHESMLFFDDEMRNITEVSRLGVTSVLVEEGMSMELFRKGLSQHSGSSDASRAEG
ncbi:magnesium-dependent phosphatase-1 [Allorhodopirellula solitaria]|uniref:Acid Phosphatase n=1 Tax=Allorhodopirellula solitaria TaxID=2527987 RepID=A0A5C5YIY8_9BACT|nr:magnesium-dependent phosphatase-1 [Allorhodopirellula solitaria]TWT74827.1 Acid Phosphatase [Allorhodopirellula solitaria]